MWPKLRHYLRRAGFDMSVTSLDALKREIDSLPPPADGRVRVFRGQTHDYGALLPSGLRGHRTRPERIWRQYCNSLTTFLLESRGSTHQDAAAAAGRWSFWYYAMSQHYGPGSNLLDVSKSVEMAVWFALHHATTTCSIGTMGPGGPDSESDVFRRDEWTEWSEWTEAPGWLFVFDVCVWDQMGPPPHGSLVDLAEAPDVFGGSARLKAQAACLIAADAATNGGDLRKLCSHPPIRVAWPMTGSEVAAMPADRVFPPPWKDEWYDRLLHVPMVHHVSRDEPRWYFGHPIPITLHLPQDPLRDFPRVTKRFKLLPPPLLFPELVRPALGGSRGGDEWSNAMTLALNATPILLEAPALALTPRPDSVLWNQAVLADGLPYEAPALDFLTDHTLPEPVQLTDIFLEFSPLDTVGWELLEERSVGFEILRAARLIRLSEWSLQIFMHTQHGLFESRLTPVRFDAQRGCYQVFMADAWSDVAGHEPYANALFVALSLLRDLSPTVKARAFVSSFRADGSLEDEPTGVSVVGQVGRLVRLPEVRTGWGYYHVREANTGEPYLLGASPGIGEIRLEHRVAYSSLSGDCVRRLVAEQQAAS